MQTEALLPTPFPEPDQFSLRPYTLHAPFLYSMRDTFPAHLILLGLNTRIYYEEYKSWSSSLCNFLQ